MCSSVCFGQPLVYNISTGRWRLNDTIAQDVSHGLDDEPRAKARRYTCRVPRESHHYAQGSNTEPCICAPSSAPDIYINREDVRTVADSFQLLQIMWYIALNDTFPPPGLRAMINVSQKWRGLRTFYWKTNPNRSQAVEKLKSLEELSRSISSTRWTTNTVKEKEPKSVQINDSRNREDGGICRENACQEQGTNKQQELSLQADRDSTQLLCVIAQE